MPEKLNTELPLEFDYFGIGESWDTETVRGFLNEFNQIGGIRCNYYHLQDAGLHMDPVFLEKSKKRFEYPISIKFVLSYIEEIIENMNAGITLLDTIDMTIEMSYFKDVTKFKKPIIGSLIQIPYAGLFFEVENVVDSDAIFFGHKMTWKLTCKVYQESFEDDDITNEVYTPDTAPGEDNNFMDNLTDEIEEKSEEGYTYKKGDNPFGDY